MEGLNCHRKKRKEKSPELESNVEHHNYRVWSSNHTGHGDIPEISTKSYENQHIIIKKKVNYT